MAATEPRRTNTQGSKTVSSTNSDNKRPRQALRPLAPRVCHQASIRTVQRFHDSEMSDARSLLRQQRAARRINHPHASYTDTGKLTCTVCHEPLKSDALWEGHARSVGHRQRLLAQQKSRQQRPQQASPPASTTGANGSGPEKSKSGSTDTLSDEALLAQIIGGPGATGAGAGGGQKRKHGDTDSDVEMDDVDNAEEDTIRTKRSKQDISSPTAPSSAAAAAMSNTAAPSGSSNSNGRKDSPADIDASKKTPPSSTPPALTRRTSGTPSHGVELQIPSRPATPNANGASGGSTPRTAPIGRSPLIPQEGQGPGSATTSAPRASFVTAATKPTGATTSTAAEEDEDWAAFEAEVVNAPPPPPPTLPTNPAAAAAAAQPTTSGAAGYSADAVIAAAPLTAEQVAAKSREEEREGRRALAEAQLEDEKEEATRALETEFEEMEELEARVRRLKEKREAIRRGSVPAAPGAAAEGEDTKLEVNTEEAGGAAEAREEDDDEEEDEEDEEEDDDWAGFRFRA